MFEVEPLTLDVHDQEIGLGFFGGDAGFIASRPINPGDPLDAGFKFTGETTGNVAFVLVVTVVSG